jgi:site-specific DNA recombinase
MIAAMAQWEREEIADRVAASVPIRAKLGKPLGGQAPFGYQWKDKKLIPDHQEVPIRKLLHELFLEHQRKKTVARLLNQAGHRTRQGAKFTDTTIGRLLRDPTAKGLHRANYTHSLGDKKKWVMKDQGDWVITPVEPIIPEALWDQCNQILDEQEKTNKKPARKAVHLFTGYVGCECSGSFYKMYVPSNSPKYICQKCRNKIETADLESIFHQQLKDFFFSSQEIAEYLNKADHIIQDREDTLKSLEEEKRKVQREMDKVYRAYIDDQIPVEIYGGQYRPLDERLKQIENHVPEIQGEIDFLKIQYLSSDQILSEAKDLYSRWPELQPTEKRQIIENITDKIIIGPEEVSIHLCYLPTTTPKFMTSEQRNFRDSWPPPA